MQNQISENSLMPYTSRSERSRNLEQSVKAHSVDEGFARLDALSRIGNTVFALDLDHHENFVAYSAPVHFPRIWDASWFEWVQYNGSIQQPMTRNAGEALGVRATVNFPVAKDQLPTSSVQVNTIFQLEQLLAGDKPPTAENRFTGLASPKWPDKILPPINAKLAAEGAALYQDALQALPPARYVRSRLLDRASMVTGECRRRALPQLEHDRYRARRHRPRPSRGHEEPYGRHSH